MKITPFPPFILVILLADGMTKRNPHDRTVEDKKALVDVSKKKYKLIPVHITNDSIKHF